MGLNESLFQISGQFLLMDPIPPISKVFSLVLQYEKQREVGDAIHPSTQVAFAVKNVNGSNNSHEKPKP